MNKFKKIGLTALAGSLVAVSAQAGELNCYRWCKHHFEMGYMLTVHNKHIW